MDNKTKHQVASFDQLPREVAEAHDKLDLIIGMLQGILDSKKPSGPKMLTVEEAAVLLKKKVSTIYSMNTRKQLPVRHIGNKVVYFENELMEWIENDGKMSQSGETIDEHADGLANGMNHRASGTIERNSKAEEQKAIDARVKQYEERQARLKAEMEKAQNTPPSTDQTSESDQMEDDADATDNNATDAAIIMDNVSISDGSNRATSEHQESVAESGDTVTALPAEAPMPILTDVNPSTGSDQGHSLSSFPSVSVETREHTRSHKMRFVIVFAQSLTTEQQHALKPVVEQCGGYLASFDNLFTFDTAEQAQQCCETIGKMK